MCLGELTDKGFGGKGQDPTVDLWIFRGKVTPVISPRRFRTLMVGGRG